VGDYKHKRDPQVAEPFHKVCPKEELLRKGRKGHAQKPKGIKKQKGYRIKQPKKNPPVQKSYLKKDKGEEQKEDGKVWNAQKLVQRYGE
jgi:hypothetical protein